MGLSEKEIILLEICEEEPANLNLIAKTSKVQIKEVQKILSSLEKRDFVHSEQVTKKALWWFTTLKGSKIIKKLRNSRQGL